MKFAGSGPFRRSRRSEARRIIVPKGRNVTRTSRLCDPRAIRCSGQTAITLADSLEKISENQVLRMVEPRGIEPLTFAMPLPEKVLQSLFFHAFLKRYQQERDKNIDILRYRCDTSLSVAEHAVTRPYAPKAIA
jgi:hypothetical protein